MKEKVDRGEIREGMKLCNNCNNYGHMFNEKHPWCTVTEKTLLKGKTKCKYYTPYKDTWTEILEYHARHIGSSDHVWCRESKSWRRPIKPDRRWN